MDNPAIKIQIIQAVSANHKEQVEKGEPVGTSVANLRDMLPGLNEQEIMDAIAEMNSVRIVDAMTGSLEFFPTCSDVIFGQIEEYISRPAISLPWVKW